MHKSACVVHVLSYTNQDFYGSFKGGKNCRSMKFYQAQQQCNVKIQPVVVQLKEQASSGVERDGMQCIV